jgi:exodeoxyribonuclease VII small subunit
MSVKNNETVTEKLAELDEMVAWFDSDDFELEQALEKFTQAEKLAAEIERDLLALKNSITVVKEKFDKVA